MKQVVPNITDVLVSRYIGVLGRLRKFARYWGTTTVDGIEVFTPRKFCYPDMDESTTKVTKLLGIYDEVKSKQPGIRSTWLYFNPSKSLDSTTDWDATVIANNLNLALVQGLSCSVVIGPKIRNRKQDPADIVSPVTDQPALIAEIESKYQDLWNSQHSFFTGEDDPYLSLLALYILRSSDVPYTIRSVAETVSTSYLPSAANLDGITASDQAKAWRVNVVIPDYVFTPTTDIVTLLAEDVTQVSKPTAVLQVLERFGTAILPATPSDGSDEGTPDQVYQSIPMTLSDFWYTKITPGYEGIDLYEYFLKTSILTTPTLNNKQKLEYLMASVDMGFRKKKRKWYEIVIAFVIIIIAVWAAGPAGAAAAAPFVGFYGTVVMIAVTITVAALYISIAAMAASYMGAYNVAASLGQFLRTVGPLVQIAGVVALVTGIYGAIRRGIQQAVTTAAQEGAKTTLSSIASNVASSVVQTVTGLTKLTSMTMSHIVKMLSFTFDIYKDMETRDLQRELKNYRTEIAALSESKERTETSDIVKDLMASYPNPLASDWSYYSDIYDRPYEWWSTPYHTGNIQATTVNALWLNDPQNAILYNNSTGD